jgi:hypothetical protein
MKSLKTTLFLTIGLSATLVLAGCTPAQDEPTPSPTASASETPSPSATPGEGSSGEVELGDTTTTLETSDVAPAWAAPVFSAVPAGKWVYASDDSQVIATTDTFEADALRAYVQSLLDQEWQVSVEGEETAESYIKSLLNPKTGESVTVIGMTKAVPDASGAPAKPASSIVYKK